MNSGDNRKENFKNILYEIVHWRCRFAPEKITERLAENMDQLFDGNRIMEDIFSTRIIVKGEVRLVLGNMKTREAAGPDEVVTDILRAFDEVKLDLVQLSLAS